MGISPAIIDQIRQQTSIEDVVSQVVSLEPSRQNGKMKGLCPFHQEDTPSFTVDTIKNLYYCFGCQEGGDTFDFVQKTRGVGFIEAVRDLAKDCGISLREQTPEEIKRFKKIDSLYEVCQLAAEYFHRELSPPQPLKILFFCNRLGTLDLSQNVNSNSNRSLDMGPTHHLSLFGKPSHRKLCSAVFWCAIG